MSKQWADLVIDGVDEISDALVERGIPVNVAYGAAAYAICRAHRIVMEHAKSVRDGRNDGEGDDA